MNADDLKEDVIRKVRKLLALSTSSNPNEAAAAAEKARKLLLQHGLEMTQLGEEPGEVKQETWRDFSGRRDFAILLLVSTVAEANMCQGWSATSLYQNRHGLIGRPAAIACAIAQIDYLYEALTRHSAEKKAQGFSRPWRNDYRRAWVAKIWQRLQEAKRMDTVEERGLILVEDGAVEAYAQELWGNKVDKSSTYRKPQHADALRAGAKDASTVALTRQIEQV